jgi:tetratricopeptide (TPR) repeat protein
MHRAETWALLWLSMAVPLLSPRLLPVPSRRLAWLRYSGAAFLLVAGGCLAFVPLAAGYAIAQGESDESCGRWGPSQASFRAALQWEPWSPDANFDLTRVMARTGDYAGALAQSRVATGYVNEPELYILRSRILQNAGRNAEAGRELEAATRLFPYSTKLRDEVAKY